MTVGLFPPAGSGNCEKQMRNRFLHFFVRHRRNSRHRRDAVESRIFNLKARNSALAQHSNKIDNIRSAIFTNFVYRLTGIRTIAFSAKFLGGDRLARGRGWRLPGGWPPAPKSIPSTVPQDVPQNSRFLRLRCASRFFGQSKSPLI